MADSIFPASPTTLIPSISEAPSISAYEAYMRTPAASADLSGQPNTTSSIPSFANGHVVYADAPSTSLVPGFVRSPDLMTLDPDAFGTKTVGWGQRTGQALDSTYVAGLNVFGRAMSREQLLSSDAGRKLLEIATKNREGKRRGFLEALTDFEWGDLPFVGLIASVGGSISDAVTVSDTMKKLQNGEPVTDDELIKTRLYMAKQERDADGTWGATVGSIVRAAPGFMVEFFASAGTLAAGRAALTKAGVGGASLALTRGTKILAREAIESATEKVVTKAVGKAASRAAISRGFADLAGTASEREIVDQVSKQLFGFMKSEGAAHMYKGFSDEALQAMAKNRAQHEFGKLLARRGGSALSNGFHSFTQWAGSNISRGLIDFGAYGSEEATVLFTRQSTAGRALADALGVFMIEAPVKGSVLMLPKKAVEYGVVAPLAGGRTVSANQLALQTTALMTDNKSLMDNSEALAFGMDLMEYISENTGRGLKSLLAAGGIGLERMGVKGLVRPAVTAISSVGTALPTEGAEAVAIGGRMRRYIQQVFGSRADYARKVMGQEADLVASRLGVAGADREAIRVAVMSGNAASLRPELRQAIGPDLNRFVQDTVKQAYDKGVKDLQYKNYARYAVAKWMQKHQVGPETVMNMFNQMGYDGVLGEMFEERYSDVVKGLLGLDERKDTVKVIPGVESPEGASFFNNLKEAVKGIYPGWDQLTAEAVGFMFPMVTRGAVMRVMSAVGGGGELADLRARLDVINDAMRHNTVGEMTYSDAVAAFDYARQQDANEVADLTRKLEAARQAGDAAAVDAIEKELATRRDAATRRAERQKLFFDSVDEAAKNTADALIAVPIDTYGTLSNEMIADRAPVMTEAEARQTLDAQRALGDFASQLARRMVEAQLPLEGESEGTFRKLARKLIGISGFLVTGDYSLAAMNPAQWTARDMGLSKQVVDSLRDGFRKELSNVHKLMPEATSQQILDETQRRFDLKARQIMAANLAVHQLRSFSDGRLREEATAQWATTHADEDGRQWQYTVDKEGKGSFYKFAPDGKTVDEESVISLEEMYNRHRAEVDEMKLNILKATVDAMSRRITGMDAGARNTVLAAMTLERNSDMLDTALYDAAMRLIGAQNLVYKVSLDGRTPLKSVIESGALGRMSSAVLDYIASKSRIDDVDPRALESVAQALKLPFDGTEEGLAARNEKVFRIAQLLRFNRREGRLYFSKEIFEEDSDALRMSANGTSTLVADRQSDGRYVVDYGARKDDPRQRDRRTFETVEELTQAMSADGYIQDASHLVVTQTKVIESSDMFWMIRELGLAKEYYERLGERKPAQMHPMLRRGADGKFLPQDEAEAILAKEITEAHKGQTAEKGSAARRVYERVFGDDGYMTVGEHLLADHHVVKNATAPYTGEFHDYAPSRYSYAIRAGRISPKSADVYVTVDPTVNSDLTSGIVAGILVDAFGRNGALLRDALGNVVSDFVMDVRRIAKEARAEALAKKDHELVRQLDQFIRTCCDDVDREVRLQNGKSVVRRGIGLSAVGFVTLADAFGLFHAQTDTANPMRRALATIAPQVWNAPSFQAFEGLLNATLGGNLLDSEIWRAKPGAKNYADPAVTGIPRILALTTANPDAMREAVQHALPAGLNYEQFLDAVLRQMTALSKTGEPGITDAEKQELKAKARAAQAAAGDVKPHYTFMGGLVSTLKATIDNKLVVSNSVADFFTDLLQSISADPTVTDAQRQAAVKQLNYIRKRAENVTAQETYVEQVNEVVEAREAVAKAEAKVAEAKQKLQDMDRRELQGEPVADADRQQQQTELHDYSDELSATFASLLQKEEAQRRAAAPEGLRALYLGGEAEEQSHRTTASEAEDDGDAAITMDSDNALPEGFAREAERHEDGFTTSWGRTDETIGYRLTNRQAKLAVSCVVRSMATDSIDEDTFVRQLKRLFPHMQDVEVQDVIAGFRELDAARLSSGRGWGQMAVAGQHFGFMEDEKSDEDKSSENFNERALAEYNSEAFTDFVALAKRSAAETNGSIMGFVDMLRGRVRERQSDTPAARLLNLILNPQMVPGIADLSQADAHHKRALRQFDDPAIQATIESTIDSDPQAALLLSYLSALPINARTRFAGLCFGAVATTPIHAVNGLMARKEFLPDGKIPDTLIGDSFDCLVGLPAHRLSKIAKELRDGAAALELVKTGENLADLKENAAKVAELIAKVFGTKNSPLYTALTSHISHRVWASIAGSSTLSALVSSVSKNQDGGVDAIDTIASAIELLASRRHEATRLDVESVFVAALSMGGFSNVGLRRAPSRMDITDPLLTFMTEFQTALPRTMMHSEIDQERERTISSVVVAPRGMVPLLSRWLYQNGKDSFTDICKRVWNASDGLIAECRQDGTWPDSSRTPICAKCLSSSLTPREVYRACRDAYQYDSSHSVAWVPIYSGDHSSFTLLQLPRETIKGDKTYKDLAKAAYKAIGMNLMFTDTKRAAISSLEAQGAGLVGVSNDNTYGEHRVHIIHSWQPGTKNEAFLGSTFMHGYGVKSIGDMSMDPGSDTKKVHIVGGAGRDLFFIKSLTISQNGARGQFREGSAPRAVFDYLEKFRGNDALSTDTLTDDDSYKIGPGNSKGIRVRTTDGRDMTVMGYTFSRLHDALVESGELAPGADMEAMAKAFKAKYSKLTGDALDALVGLLPITDLVRGTTSEVKLSEILPGAMVNVFEGWTGAALDLSYQENSAMAYTVANVSHRAVVPADPGRSPRNYELDTLAMLRTLSAGGWLETPELQKDFYRLMADWGLLASAVYGQSEFRAALVRTNENLASLSVNGEFLAKSGAYSGQFAVEEITRQVMAKVRQAANLPLQGIDAPLVAAGASIGPNGELVAHTTSKMEAAMLKGSEVFTPEEQSFYGTNRRLALCNVNVRNNGFRYGWFLSPKAEEVYPEAYRGGDEMNRAGTNAQRRHAMAIAWAAREVRRATRDYDEHPEDAAKKTAALEARKRFASMFVDHRNIPISAYDARYLATFSVEDLFVPTADGAEEFDLSAVQCEGQDLVYNDASKTEHVFLGGTMFGLPRTPSYNGSMWLQTVRAGLPVTEEVIADAPSGTRDWLPGADAMVSPDPYTNAILGCDHDGDKSKIYMLSVNARGAVKYSTLAPAPVARGEDYEDAEGKASLREFLNDNGQAKNLERVRIDANGNEQVVDFDDDSPDTYYRISTLTRKRVSNSFVRTLFSLSRQLPVDRVKDEGNTVVTFPALSSEGTRAKFLGGVASSVTKPFPTDNKDAILSQGLPMVIDPKGSKGTLGDPELAAEIATSAMDAADARGIMVSLARTLHMAWALGTFKDLLGPMTGAEWLRFMYHVDGISNATFDDIKEQICGRLGWTRGMMDSVLTELLLFADRIPKTDAEFAEILAKYASNIKGHGSRYWMLRASRQDDSEAHKLVTGSLIGSGRLTKASLMATLGLEEVTNENGGTTVKMMEKPPATVGTAVGRALLSLPEASRWVRGLLDMTARDRGHNPAAGLLYSVIVRGLAKSLPSLTQSQTTADGVTAYTFNLMAKLTPEDMSTVARAVKDALGQMQVPDWVKRRAALTHTRAVEASLNYLTADPGAPAAVSARRRGQEAFASYTREGIPFAADGVPPVVVKQMYGATQLMYDIGADLYTCMSRAVQAAVTRNDTIGKALETHKDSLVDQVALGLLLAKDTISSGNLLDLQHNQQQVPFLVSFFTGGLDDVLSRIPVRGDRLTGKTVYQLLQRLADNVASSVKTTAEAGAGRRTYGQGSPYARALAKTASGLSAYAPQVLSARVAVESMMQVMYGLMVTSSEFASDEMNRAVAFLRASKDSAYKGVGGQRSEYGPLADNLFRIMPLFRANDQKALDKVREMFGRVIRGEAFTKKRVLAGDNAQLTKVASFELSHKSLLAMVHELTGGKYKPTNLTEIKSAPIPDAFKNAIVNTWQALGEKETITPAVLFGALLPAYTLMTSRVNGVPSAESTSLLGCFPVEYYSALSAAEAALRRAGTEMVPLLVGSNLAPAKYHPDTEVKAVRLTADDATVKPGEDLQTARDRIRGGAGLREYREDPYTRDVIDIFDPAFSAAVAATPGSTPQSRNLMKATSATRLTEGEYDPKTAQMALAMGALLGSWAKVEYNGGSVFTIRGSLRGDAGTGKAVSIVVDTTEGGLLDSEQDVETLADSSAYATSLTACVDIGVTAEEFMILPKEVRKALVRKFGVGAVTSNKVAWSVNAKGVATLVGKITLPAANTKLYHEYFHSMMRMFEAFDLFGEEDYAQLRETFGEDPSGRHRFNEEKAAEAFRKWVEGNTDVESENTRSIFRRILDFLKGLWETLRQGFSYQGDEGAETLFKMMVHGIAQPSTARLAESQLMGAVVGSRLFQLQKTGRQSRSAMEEAARAEQPALASTRVYDLEELETAGQLDDSIIQRSNKRAERALAEIANPEMDIGSLAMTLQGLAQIRNSMAEQLGVAVDNPAPMTTPDFAVDETMTDPVAEEIAKVTSPLINNNFFYRTAEAIRHSLESGLSESGAWNDTLEYVISRYSSNDASAILDENLRKQSVLHGLRRAMSHVNPAAAKELSDEKLENSLAYRAALVMQQHLESSFLSRTPDASVLGAKHRARHASQYQVSAWITSSDPEAPAAMATTARDRVAELYSAAKSGASKAELRLHLDQMEAILDLVGDQTSLAQFRRDQGMLALNEIIARLRAGVKDPGVDEQGQLRDFEPIDVADPAGDLTDAANIGTQNPYAGQHLKTFIQSHTDPAVQESLKLVLSTAYQIAAMAKFYGELDIHPAPAGDIAEAKRLARLNHIPEHMSSLEFLGEHLVGDSNLVDNPAYVDYQCQSHFIANNIDAWLRSMVRSQFGAHEGLGQMMSDEHFEYMGLINAVTAKENWFAHMLGTSLEPGGYLLKVLKQTGEYKMVNGEVIRRPDDSLGEFVLEDGTTARAKLRVNDTYTLVDGRTVRKTATGYELDGKPVRKVDEYVKFDNYGRKATSVKMTEDDIRRVDMWLKMCSAHASKQRAVVTGVDDISFYRQLSREYQDYSIEKVVAKYEHGGQLNAVEWAIWRMTRQIPADLLSEVHSRFVSGMLEAMAHADQMLAKKTPARPGGEPAVYDAATYNSYVIGELDRKGILVGFNPGRSTHKVGGIPRYENAALLLPCDDIDSNFQGSDTYQKLIAAGREKAWLDRDYVANEFMQVWNDTARFVKRHPWLTHGDGQFFHAFGTALPFWRGSGVYMYNAVRTERANRVTLSDKMSQAEELVKKINESNLVDMPLAIVASDSDSQLSLLNDLDILARFYGTPHRAAQLFEEIVAGRYAPGEDLSVRTGLTLAADATYGDIARAIYNRARQMVWESRTGYAGSGTHLDLENIIARYEDTRLQRGEIFGGSMGFTDLDMYRMNGTLPANYQIGHKVHKCIDGITNAMMSRATLANLLLTPEGSTGAPVYYADPNRLAAEASGLPDSFWDNLAEWWQAHNPEVGQVYDPAKSGVENAKAVYQAIREKHQIEGKPRKAQIGELGYTELPGDDSTLVSVDRWMVLDGNGEDFMNATAGGEAMGYLKHFLDAGKVLGLGGAGVRAAIQRALSYSKSLSVSFSFFFPMATRWESPMGAVGAMSTIGSNWKWVGDWMKEHPDAANKIRGMFGGKAWITHDFIGMKDIVRMMDSNDPFLAELYSWASALGITVSTSVTNPMEPDKTVLLKDVRRMKEALRSTMGAEAAGKFARMMDAILVRQGDKAFNYVLNATKLAVVAQLCMKLRYQAKAKGKAFDPVRDLKKYSRYINAEIGGIDPMQFAWAHPKARQLMNMALFSWQWTVGAWQAGGGSVLTDMLTGSKTMIRQERAYFAGRWMRMFLGVMIGVPMLFQVITLALAKAMGGGDDEDDHWGTWENEDKTKWSAFDLTPLLKAINQADDTKLGGIIKRYKENGGLASAALGAIGGAIYGFMGGGNRLTALIGAALGAGGGAMAPKMIPIYTGSDAANRTTRNRRYYMHFGKQGWEFFRWFDDAWAQFNSKLSMPTQRVLEGIVGRSLGYIERSLPWDEQGQFERWLSPTTDSALFNLAEAFLPFSVSGMNRNGDAGVLPIFGPVQMGASQTSTQKRLVKALTAWAKNDRAGYAFGMTRKGSKTGKPVSPVTDILRDAEKNGLDPKKQLDKACGQVMVGLYSQMFDLLPEKPTDDYDTREFAKVVRALNRLGGKRKNAFKSMKDRFETQTRLKSMPKEDLRTYSDVVAQGFRDPFGY